VRFLADMGVSYSVVLHLRQQGYDIVHLRDIGAHRMPDEAIFAQANRERRVILTFDLDFARLVFDARAAFPSVIIYRLTDSRTHHQIERLMAALRIATMALEAGAVVVVDDNRVRIRELPIG
jgi:predicted nuclease of predicted toxin-antitoxin system